MNVLVTGGTGFIGGNLTEKLVRQNYNVRCLVRHSSNTELLRKKNVDLFCGDLSDKETLSKATKGVDCVFHCAALVTDWAPYDKYLTVNVDGTRNLIDACVKNYVNRLIYVSSTDAVWNYNDHFNIDEKYPYPKKYKHPYCESKARAEKICLDFYNRGTIETVILRPCWVWGPGDKVVLPKLVELALNNKLFLIGNGNNLVSLIYISNLTDALINASLSDKAKGNIYFIQDDTLMTIQQYLICILKILNINVTNIRSIPYLLAYNYAYLLELYTRIKKLNTNPQLTRYLVSVMNKNFNYDISKIKKDLNYRPAIGFEEGLLNLKKWVDDLGGVHALI